MDERDRGKNSAPAGRQMPRAVCVPDVMEGGGLDHDGTPGGTSLRQGQPAAIVETGFLPTHTSGQVIP